MASQKSYDTDWYEIKKRVKNENEYTFVKRVRALIEKNKMNQKEFSDRVGLGKSTISNYCNGKQMPQMNELLTISNFCEVSIDYLVGLSDAATLNKDLQMIVKYTGLSEQSINTLINLKQTPEMGKDITDNLYVLTAIDFLLSHLAEFPLLKLIGEYLFNDYKPYYEEEYTLEELNNRDKNGVAIEGVWDTIQQLNESLSNEELVDLMQNNIWVNCDVLSPEQKNENEDEATKYDNVIEPIPLKDLKAAIIVRLNQELGKCYDYLHEDKSGKDTLKQISKEARKAYKQRLKLYYNKKE